MTDKYFIDRTMFAPVCSLSVKLNFIKSFVFFEAIRNQFDCRRITFHFFANSLCSTLFMLISVQPLDVVLVSLSSVFGSHVIYTVLDIHPSL